MWQDNTELLCTNSRKELKRNCSPIGHNNTKHFLCPIRSWHPLEFLEIARRELVPRALSPVLENFRRALSPDWLPLGLRGCVILSKVPLLTSLFFDKKWVPEKARLIFSSSKYCRDRKCYSFKNCVALLPWFWWLRHYVTCSHGTDCHAESTAGRVQCFKMAKIDPVSTFYPTLWLKKGILQWENLQEVQKNEPLGCKYLLLCVSKLEVFTQLPPAYHENSWTSMVSYGDYIQ